MIKYIRKIYRGIVPIKTRKKIESFLFDVNKPRLKKKIVHLLKKYERKGNITPEQKEVLEYLKQRELTVFPYTFTEKYKPEDIEVFLDITLGLRYVIYEGKRLYFKCSWTEKKIQKAFSNLLIEQHPDSPHCYLGKNFTVETNDTVVDIGVAEGNFALSVIEKVKSIYIFERDKEWIDALNATFAPWKDKVHIVNKWVSDMNDEVNITLDNYFNEIDIDFIKIDVDGLEHKLLAGSENILSRPQKLKIAICTYHNQDDEVTIAELLKKKKFSIHYSNGYMIFHWGEMKPPFIRRGLIRSIKQ